MSFRAGLRCCLSRAWSLVVACARWPISHLHAVLCARFFATWRSSSAVRSSCAGRMLRSIAGLSKQRYRAGHRRRSVLPSNESFKRTAPPPLNSSVRRQSSILLSLCRVRRFQASHRLRVLCRFGLACVVVFRALGRSSCLARAFAYLASSCSAVRAVRRNVPFVVSGSFFARRPQASRHCRAFKAALSCCSPTA